MYHSNASYIVRKCASNRTAIDNLLDSDKEMRNNVSLLQSIPGVGSHSAALLLGEIGDILLFKKPKQLAAYFGLDPTERQSGSFRGTKNKLSKRGSPMQELHFTWEWLIRFVSAERTLQRTPYCSVIMKKQTGKGCSSSVNAQTGLYSLCSLA